MKRSISILLALFIMGCTSSNMNVDGNTELLGKWKLMEQLSDPGDGSGVYVPITSNRVVQFFSNGTVSMNGILCYMSSEVGDTNTGIYSELTEDNTFFDGEILPDNCEYSEAKVCYSIKEGKLILYYQCIEGCAQKFSKL